ncbi:hypothetical protein [Streptomyces sp. NPDC017202]|uniref:hypothetical protein n=1 Tax=Streptomyces sp. NPDC017202 TaxID=3364981 RepID=UPI0037BE1EA5
MPTNVRLDADVKARAPTELCPGPARQQEEQGADRTAGKRRMRRLREALNTLREITDPWAGTGPWA